MEIKYVFPFPAVIGQDKIKKALIVNVINPLIGGVLICGEKGTAKSTLVRGLGEIMSDIKVVNLPLNITEDRLIGSINIKQAINRGEKVFEEGILSAAHNNILYIDEVNLLCKHIINCILEVSSSGINIVEREGISHIHKSQFILVGTMNPEEGQLIPQLLDRFGLFVEVKGVNNIDKRKEIIKRRLKYEKNPQAYIKEWNGEIEQLRLRIAKAKSLLNMVSVSNENMKFAVQLSREGVCQGHRAEIIIIETAKALAAFANRTYIKEEDIKEAAEFALPHRIKQAVMEKQSNQQQKNSEKNNDINDENIDANTSEADEELDMNLDNNDNYNCEQQDEINNIEADYKHESEMNVSQKNKCSEKVDDIGNTFNIVPIFDNKADKFIREGSGKRIKTKTNEIQGRYVKNSFPKGEIKDIAFDATFRACAPYQKFRKTDSTAVCIKPSDIRVKVREKRTGSTILFVVDASGSMAANKRMKAVKGAVLSLLTDAYEKRDKVGMIAFRKGSADVILGITRSIELAHKKLKELPTGGKTPLADGILKGLESIKAERMKDKDNKPLLVIVTDGKANYSSSGKEPYKEALEVCKQIVAEGIESLIIDSEEGFLKLGLAKDLAEEMKGEYYKIEDLKGENIVNIVRKTVR